MDDTNSDLQTNIIDFVENIEFSNDVKPKTEIKEEEGIKIELKEEKFDLENMVLYPTQSDIDLDTTLPLDIDEGTNLKLTDTQYDDFISSFDPKRNQLNCTTSKESLSKKLAISVHEEKKSTKPICRLCSKTFTSKVYLKAHMVSVHEGKKPFFCKICDSSFSRERNLRLHISTVHDGNKPFKCDLCELRFTVKHNMKRHMENVHEGKKPTCTSCHKTFTSRSYLKVHIESVHFGKRSFKCIKCESRFATKSDLKIHIETFHEGKKPLVCDICEQKFATNSNLKKHFKLAHVRRPYKCHICIYAASYHIDLKKHIEVVHEGQKLFSCELYGQSCLTKHKALYYKEFQCDSCNLRYSTKALLAAHISSAHEGKKNFHCTICDKKFALKEYLSKHFSSVHEKNKPFKTINPPKELTAQPIMKQPCAEVISNLPTRVFKNPKISETRPEPKNRGISGFGSDKPDSNMSQTRPDPNPNFLLPTEDKPFVNCPSLNCDYKTTEKEDFVTHIELVHKGNIIIDKNLDDKEKLTVNNDFFQVSCPSLNCNYKTKIKKELDNHIKITHGKYKVTHMYAKSRTSASNQRFLAK